MIIFRSHPTWWGSCQKECVFRLSKIKTWYDHLVICVPLAVLQPEYKKNQKRKKPQNKTKNINPETRPILLINMAEIKSEEEACLLYIILPQAGDKLQSIRCLAVCLCAFLYIRYAIFLKKWPKIGIDTQT